MPLFCFMKFSIVHHVLEVQAVEWFRPPRTGTNAAVPKIVPQDGNQQRAGVQTVDNSAP